MTRCRDLLLGLAGLEQRPDLGRNPAVTGTLILYQLCARFSGGRLRLVEDRLNPKKTFRRLIHSRDKPACLATLTFRLRNPEPK
jgi:hypothetical protein